MSSLIDQDVQIVSDTLRTMLEAARQRGYDAGYEDALSLARERPLEQLGQQDGIGDSAQRVA